MRSLHRMETVNETRVGGGWLELVRRRLRNHYADESCSEIFDADCVFHPGIDAVGVLAWRRAQPGRSEASATVQVLLRECLRPGIALHDELRGRTAAPRPLIWELACGVLEPDEQGPEGLLDCGVRELFEEMGVRVQPDELRPLGGAFYPSAGVLAEAIHLFSVQLLPIAEPGLIPGDGSPYEDVGRVSWWSLDEALSGCLDGRMLDAKTEIAMWRLVAKL